MHALEGIHRAYIYHPWGLNVYSVLGLWHCRPQGVKVSLILPIYVRTLALGWTFYVPAGGCARTQRTPQPTALNKCHTLHAHRKKQSIIHTYTMDNTPVTPVTHHPYLGIELQSDLRWTTHIGPTEHNQQSTEGTKHAEKKPQTSLHNCKITGIQNNSQTST